MSHDPELLTVKEAAALYNPRMLPASFRTVVCPLLAERHGLRVRKVQRRVILIYRQALLDLMEEEAGAAVKTFIAS